MVMEIPKTPKFNTFVPSKTDMSHCPLCLKKWKIYEEPTKQGKAYFFCLEDSISIWVRDPLLGRWANIEKEPCPVCGEKEMRLFFRRDEYMKMKCPKCGCCIENVDPKKHQALLKKEEMEGRRKTISPEKPKDVES